MAIENRSGHVSELLADASCRAAKYKTNIHDRRVAPTPEQINRLQDLAGAVPEQGTDAQNVISLLDEIGSPATVANTSGRYFGFVTGGTLPASLAANWLAAAWDQNVSFQVMSPAAARIEEIALEWLRQLFHLPDGSAGSLVTGATSANFTAICAARHALLARTGWNVEEDGLFGAPPISVVVGQEVHVSMLKALSLAGFGHKRVSIVPTDDQGRMIPARLPELNDRTLVCIQAGNVNSGAFDPAAEICRRANDAGAWVHVDGAFGLWAATAPERAHWMSGFADADSWSTDCHKWLNVPYDCGVTFVREPRHLFSAMAMGADYLQVGAGREPCHYTPEFSRRARGVEIWAAVKSLGRKGIGEMVERNCRQAAMFADRLRSAGFDVLNDVVLNQVLVSFGDSAATRRVVAGVQADGTCWCGGTEWHGKAAMRISVSCWATTDDDIQLSADAIVRIAQSCGARTQGHS